MADQVKYKVFSRIVADSDLIAVELGDNWKNKIIKLTKENLADYGQEHFTKLFNHEGFLVAATWKEQLIGFTFYYWLDYSQKNRKILDISLTVIDRNWQRKKVMTKIGILGYLQAWRQNKYRNFFLGFRTANPVIYKNTIKYLQLWPNTEIKINPKSYQDVGRIISEFIDSRVNYDPEKMIAIKAYHDRLDMARQENYILRNTFKDPDGKIKKFFANSLNYKKGDAFIFTSKTNYKFLCLLGLARLTKF